MARNGINARVTIPARTIRGSQVKTNRSSSGGGRDMRDQRLPRYAGRLPFPELGRDWLGKYC